MSSSDSSDSEHEDLPPVQLDPQQAEEAAAVENLLLLQQEEGVFGQPAQPQPPPPQNMAPPPPQQVPQQPIVPPHQPVPSPQQMAPSPHQQVPPPHQHHMMSPHLQQPIPSPRQQPEQLHNQHQEYQGQPRNGLQGENWNGNGRIHPDMFREQNDWPERQPGRPPQPKKDQLGQEVPWHREMYSPGQWPTFHRASQHRHPQDTRPTDFPGPERLQDNSQGYYQRTRGDKYADMDEQPPSKSMRGQRQEQYGKSNYPQPDFSPPPSHRHPTRESGYVHQATGQYTAGQRREPMRPQVDRFGLRPTEDWTSSATSSQQPLRRSAVLSENSCQQPVLMKIGAPLIREPSGELKRMSLPSFALESEANLLRQRSDAAQRIQHQHIRNTGHKYTKHQSIKLFDVRGLLENTVRDMVHAEAPQEHMETFHRAVDSLCQAVAITDELITYNQLSFDHGFGLCVDTASTDVRNTLPPEKAKIFNKLKKERKSVDERKGSTYRGPSTSSGYRGREPFKPRHSTGNKAEFTGNCRGCKAKGHRQADCPNKK